MFAPLNYVWEDPAKGNASAAWGHSSPRSTRAVMLIWKLPWSKVYRWAIRARLRFKYASGRAAFLRSPLRASVFLVMQGTIKLLQVCI